MCDAMITWPLYR